MRILIVEDDSAVRAVCAQVAGALGFATEEVDTVSAARAALSGDSIDLALVDLKVPGSGGLLLLKEICARHSRTAVIVMTAFATVDSAVEAMRLGAEDHLTKPFTAEELSLTLRRAVERRSFNLQSRKVREHLSSGKGMGNLVGKSPAMEKLYRIVLKVTDSRHPVLILGESGVGKEMVARTIHQKGPNASKPFVPVECGSLAPAQIESELFGHVKGAFAGADRSKTGLLAAAGTVFLDGIGELPLDIQTKLLRALQEREVRPVGSTQPIPMQARILASTHQELPEMVERGRFRKDLYFRLNIVSLRIPPLRERKEDIPLLAAQILERLAQDSGIPYTFSGDSLRLLMEYDWPGNVRELEHAIERACALSSGPVLHLSDFPTQLQDFQRHAHAREQAVTEEHAEAAKQAERHEVISIAELEKQAILNTIRQLNGDKLLAARLLGIGKTTLYRKLKEYGIEGSE